MKHRKIKFSDVHSSTASLTEHAYVLWCVNLERYKEKKVNIAHLLLHIGQPLWKCHVINTTNCIIHIYTYITFINTVLHSNMFHNKEKNPRCSPEKFFTFFNVSLPSNFIFSKHSSIFFHRQIRLIKWYWIPVAISVNKHSTFNTWFGATNFSIRNNLQKNGKISCTYKTLIVQI